MVIIDPLSVTGEQEGFKTVLQRPVTLIQISDCHLFADDNRALLGIKTQRSFADVIRLIRDQEGTIDQILVTGDISQDDSQQSYRYCHDVLSDMKVPFAWLRGNHDDMPDSTETLFEENFPHSLSVGNWVLLLLDTHSHGNVHGKLNPADLDRLESQLVSYQDRPILVAMHHHPLPLGSSWVDDISLINGSDVMTLLRGYPQVQTIIHGHAHQEQDNTHQGVRILGAPSTCVQFLPKASDFAVDTLQPGYRRLRLYPDGQIETEVCRLPDDTWLPDASQPGY